MFADFLLLSPLKGNENDETILWFMKIIWI